MIPSWWYEPEVAWMWQVILHSTVATAAFALWSRRLRMPSGRSRRLMLVVVLTLPLVTAAVPGRGGEAFREGVAWLDSGRLLSLPIPWTGFHLWHLVLAVAAVAVVAGLWQELAPAFHQRLYHRPRGRVREPAPRELVERVRGWPGWEGVAVFVAAEDDDVCLATSGLPGRPRLHISRGALEQLTAAELEATLRHEHSHWRGGRWWLTHALFLVRLLQLFNPVALWGFREYLVETEIACDREAVQGRSGAAAGGAEGRPGRGVGPEHGGARGDGARGGGSDPGPSAYPGGDPRPLGRALLKVYADTHENDVATRHLLRRRVDALLGRHPVADDRPGDRAVAGAAALLALVLPWIV